SPLGTGVVDIPSDHADYVSFLLDVFYQQSPGSYRNLASVDQQIESAVGALEAYSRSNQPGATQLYRERRRSEQLLRRGIRDLGDVFMPLVRKYDDLFQRSMTLSAVAGVTDLAVPGLQFPCEAEGDPDVLHALGSHHLMGKLLCVPDLREMYHKAVAQNLAKQFALAEFALTEGLSSSILLASPRERGHTLLGVEAGISYSVADIEKKYDPAAKRSRFSVRHDAKPIEIKMNVEHDAHTNGWVSNTLVCTLFYRGFSACLIELIDRLKQTPLAGGTLFDETVIQYATEYERVPAEDGGGSGHNGSAYVTSLYSGIIPGPMVLGNIRVGRTPDQGHPAGTLGDAAPVEGLPNHIINVGNVSSTLSEMLRVPRIVPRAVPLVTVEKGRVVPTVPPGKNVEDENV
ncbi:MAG: hypothetical protein ACXVBW_06955, partial [Bdellovibrionota bacterium]